MSVRDKILKQYHDYLPWAVERNIETYKNEPSLLSEPKYLEAMSDKLAETKNLTEQNVVAKQNTDYTYEDILYDIANKIRRNLSEDEKQEVMTELDSSELSEYEMYSLLTDIIKKYNIQNWDDSLPEIIYRGVGGNLVKDDNALADGFEGIVDETGKEDRIIFVSSSPSVAANYSREDKFSEPYAQGKNVYAIRTQGLDPSKFVRDDTSTYAEALFGPQYKYLGSIPQEEIDVTDSAGNTRRVPRIEKQNYFSDANLKDVYIEPHIISAVQRRF